ncbi:MAG: alginate lyase family protein [Verrucomicrobia bacterium]|nr:alginate lyase family protein [Verrucomicrobiota bacterium]MCH8526141.1 heparinase II/III family protein [Kiritimatiellia bacterium]
MTKTSATLLILLGLSACVRQPREETDMTPSEVMPAPPTAAPPAPTPAPVPHTPAPPVRATLTAPLPGLAFYQSLDLQRTDLAAVAKAVAAEDPQAALTAYAAFLRAKDWGGALQPAAALPAGEATTPAGEAARLGQVRLLGHTHSYGDSIQWLENPTAFADWPLLLNRHGHWVDLARAYRETGNPAYVAAFESQLVSWLEQARIPDALVRTQAALIPRERGHRRPFAPAWRTIEAGERLRAAWPRLLADLLKSPHLSDTVLVRMVAAMARQADFLVEFSGPDNWMYIESEGLLTTAALFPEFPRARVWADTAWSRVSEDLAYNVYPDGAYQELTFWYQETVRSAVVSMLALAERAGLPPEPKVEQALERMMEGVMNARMPGGRLPQVNDADTISADWILRPAAQRFNRPDFDYVASFGTRGEAPAHTSVAMPHAGWGILRENWSATANALFFEAGPFGGHAHEDKLGFILYAYGQPMIIDTGRAPYGESPERRFNVGPTAHSTVLFDGLGQSRRWWQDGRLNRTEGPAEGFVFDDREAVALTSGAFGEMPEEFFHLADKGFRFVQHRRHIVWFKPDRWLVVDVFSPRDIHPATPPDRLGPNPTRPETATSLFQLSDLPFSPPTPEGMRLGNTDAPRLHFAWAGSGETVADVVRGQTEPELLGWRFANMNEGNRAIPIPTLRIQCRLPALPAAQALFLTADPAGRTRTGRVEMRKGEAPGHTTFVLSCDSGFAGGVRVSPGRVEVRAEGIHEIFELKADSGGR